MDRPELLEMAHRNSAPGMDLARFAMVFGEWDFLPICAMQQIVGVLMVSGNEIHMAIDSPFQRRRQGWRDGLNDLVQPIIDHYGCALTVAQNSDKQAQRFIERIGFVPHVIGDVVTQYRLTEIKIKKRGVTCPLLPL